MQNPSGIHIPSTPGSGPLGVEQFDLRTPANAADPGGEVDKVDALEKNVQELEESIQKMMAAAKMAATSTTVQTHEVTTPGSAPAIAAATTRVVTLIMAQILEVITPGLEGDSAASGETFPVMPHLDLSEEELAAHHPSILAPPEGPLQDFLRDEDDAVYAHGCRIAVSIQGDVDKHGRRRHCATPTAAGPAAQQLRMLGATVAARHTANHAARATQAGHHDPRHAHRRLSHDADDAVQRVDNPGLQTAEVSSS